MATTKKSQKDKDEEAALRKHPINVFQCNHPDCAKLDSMELKDFKKHCVEKHGQDITKSKGKKQMLMHMDGDYWFSYQWKWVLDSGLEFHQFTKQVRAMDDPMRYY